MSYFLIPTNFIEYYSLLLFIIINSLITILLIFLTIQAGERKSNFDKYSAYECGFDPFGDARHTFSVQFYLIAILFIIFDLEIIFLFPWALTLNSYSVFYHMILFLFLLTIGFYYEWGRGALEW